MKQRREKGQGSLVQMAGCKIWYARWYRFDGKRMCVSTKTDDKVEAQAFLNKRLGESVDGVAQPDRKLTYADLRKGLLASYVERGNKSLMTGANGEDKIPGLLQLDAFFGYPTKQGPPAVRIDTDTARMFAEQRRNEGVGNAIINRSLACLRRMLVLAHEERKLTVVPVIRLLKEPPARKGFLEDPDFEKLFSTMVGYMRPLILFLYRCGVRFGEARQIEWEQVDLDARTITLESDQTKNSEARIVPLPAQLVSMLDRVPGKARVGRVFDTTNWRKQWVAACCTAGLGKIENPDPAKPNKGYVGLIIHDLRRSGVRNLVRAGVPEVIVMKISGHRTRSIFDRYNIVSTADVQAAMKRLDTNGFKSSKRKSLTT